MNISVVIPTVNRHETISDAISKILENTVQPHEIIVVDQSKNNLTSDALSKFIETGKIIYIKDHGSGISRSKNIGWKRATGDIISFTDDDALVEPKWLESIQSSFEKENLNIGVLGGKIIPSYEQKNPNWSVPKRWEHLLPAYDQGDNFEPYKGDSLPAGVNYSIRRSLLEEFSGFDENLGFNTEKKVQIPGEDTDLSRRLKQSGFNIIYNPNCVVYHPVPLSRQNQEFLNKRIVTEGSAHAFTQLKSISNRWIVPLLMSKSITKYLYLSLNKQNSDDLFYLRGKILVFYDFLLKRE